MQVLTDLNPGEPKTLLEYALGANPKATSIVKTKADGTRLRLPLQASTPEGRAVLELLGDVRVLLEQAEKAEDQTLLFKLVGGLYFKMVLRSEPTMEEDNQKSLKQWIGVNINKIVEDFLIAFRWTTPEKLGELKKKPE